MSAVAVPTKRCPWCDRDLPATNAYFARSNHPAYRDGLYYICKPCKNGQRDWQRKRREQTHRETEWDGPAPPTPIVGSIAETAAEIERVTVYLALVRAAYPGQVMPEDVRAWVREEERRLKKLWDRKRKLMAQSKMAANRATMAENQSNVSVAV